MREKREGAWYLKSRGHRHDFNERGQADENGAVLPTR